MGEREDYLTKAAEAEKLAADTHIDVLKEALAEMAKGYRLMAHQAAKAAESWPR